MEWETAGKKKGGRNNYQSSNLGTKINWSKLSFENLWKTFKSLRDLNRLTVQDCQECQQAMQKVLIRLEDNYEGSQDEDDIQDLQQQLKWVIATMNDLQKRSTPNNVDVDKLKEIAECRDLYKILGVSKIFTESLLKKNYRELASQYHPDKAQQSQVTQDLYTRAFQTIQHAYDVLSDPSKRRVYDYQLEQAKLNDLGIPEEGLYIGSNSRLSKLSPEIQKLVNQLMVKQQGKCAITGTKFGKKDYAPYLKNNKKKHWLPRHELVCRVFAPIPGLS